MVVFKRIERQLGIHIKPVSLLDISLDKQR